jgi:dTDP-4-dehydrorhamnose reductase
VSAPARPADGAGRAILVTGADGQVGWEARRALSPLGRVVAVRRADVDLADAGALRALVRRVRPAAIVNAAAYTAVDRAESERAIAFAVNAEAPRVLAEEAARAGALMVHYSTGYVFDGTKGGAYTEEDAPAPLGVYGESKLRGEEGVAGVGAAHVVLRTSWVYAARGSNFLRTMLRLARERDEVTVVDDQRGTPTPARLLASVTAAVLTQCVDGEGIALPASQWGVYHATARGETTWYEFARRILALDSGRAGRRCADVTPIPTSRYPTAARRPAHSVLEVGKLERTFGLRMPGWEGELEAVMEEVGER